MNLTTRSGAMERGVAARMRHAVPRSLVLVAIVLALAIPATPVDAGPAIDLPRLDIQYEYDPPLNSHGYWVGDPEGGEWRVVGGELGRDDRLTLEVEIRPPSITVPLEPGPAVLFGSLGLYGDAGGDVATGASVPGIVTTVLPACPDPTDCVYQGSITLPTDRLPRLAERVRNAEDWISAVIGLTLVRTFAQGSWLQVLPLYDESRNQPDGSVSRPRHISSRMLALGAFPVGPRELWSRRELTVLDRVERLRRSVDDPSGLPDTQPLLIDIGTAACTPGWTIATATGDVLVDVTRGGPSVPVRVEVPVGVEWTVSVPNFGRGQGTGDEPRTFGPFSSDVPGQVSGFVSYDPYDCEGVESGSVDWRPASPDEVTSFVAADPADLFATYSTLPADVSPTPADPPFQGFWRPLDPADIPFDYTCGGLTFTTSDLASAAPTSDVPGPLATVIEEVGPQISDDADWYIVRQTDEAAVAFSPYPTLVDVQDLSRTDEGWRFRGGGGGCEPRAVFGDATAGRWRLDPAFPAPGPRSRTLQVIGYRACNGTQRDGKARIELTDEAVLIAIPMRTTRSGSHDECLGPTRMTVSLPEPLGQRALYDASSLPLRGANEKLDVDRTGPGTGG